MLVIAFTIAHTCLTTYYIRLYTTQHTTTHNAYFGSISTHLYGHYTLTLHTPHSTHPHSTLHTLTLRTLALLVVPSFKSIWEGRANEAHKSPMLNRERVRDRVSRDREERATREGEERRKERGKRGAMGRGTCEEPKRYILRGV